MEPSWVVKQQRAGELLNELAHRISDIKRRGELAAITDVDGVVRRVTLRLAVDPSTMFSGLVGDVVHNIRSSLDCVVYAASERHSGALDERDAVKVEFPISLTPAKFRANAAKCLRFVDDDCRAAIEQLQPYYWDAFSGNEDEAALEQRSQWHQLEQIRRLSNIDKHRAIHLAIVSVRDIWAGTDGTSVEFHLAPERPTRNGDVFGWWTLSNPDAVFHPNADAALALEFVARSGDIEPPELVHHLHHLLAHAQFVTDTIASRQLL
jgi:hypothetical protein